jgi:hypothetical protein
MTPINQYLLFAGVGIVGMGASLIINPVIDYLNLSKIKIYSKIKLNNAIAYLAGIGVAWYLYEMWR